MRHGALEQGQTRIQAHWAASSVEHQLCAGSQPTIPCLHPQGVAEFCGVGRPWASPYPRRQFSHLLPALDSCSGCLGGGWSLDTTVEDGRGGEGACAQTSASGDGGLCALSAVRRAHRLVSSGLWARLGSRAHVCPGPCQHVCAQAYVMGARPSRGLQLTQAPACLPAWVKSSPVFSSLRSFASRGSWCLQIALQGCLDWVLVGDAAGSSGLVGGPQLSLTPHPLVLLTAPCQNLTTGRSEKTKLDCRVALGLRCAPPPTIPARE